MRTLVQSFWIAALVTTAGFGTVSAQTSEEAAVREAEAERTAALRAGDVSIMDRLLAPDYTEVDVDGRIRPRTQALSLTPDAAPTEQMIVHLYQDAAVVVGREAQSRILRVWVHRSDRWRLVAQQAVRIEPGAPPMKPSAELLATPRVSRTNGDGPQVREVLVAQAALERANSVGDPQVFESLTAPDFIQVTSHGMVREKAYRVMEERLRQLSEAAPRPIAEKDETHVRVYGSIAILSARSWAKRPDGTPGMPGRFTRVWQKKPAGWQQVATISTIVTAP